MELLNKPMSFFLLEEHLRIAPDESILSINVSSGSTYQDPAISQFLRVATSTERFNGRRQRYFLPSDENRLTNDLTAAFGQRRTDIADLAELASEIALPLLSQTKRQVFAWVFTHESQRTNQKDYFVSVLQVRSTELSLEVRFEPPPFEGTWTDMRDGISTWLSRHGLPGSETLDWSWGTGESGLRLSELLGYSRTEIEVWPDAHRPLFPPSPPASGT
jgi:hypothetical protein